MLCTYSETGQTAVRKEWSPATLLFRTEQSADAMCYGQGYVVFPFLRMLCGVEVLSFFFARPQKSFNIWSVESSQKFCSVGFLFEWVIHPLQIQCYISRNKKNVHGDRIRSSSAIPLRRLRVFLVLTRLQVSFGMGWRLFSKGVFVSPKVLLNGILLEA